MTNWIAGFGDLLMPDPAARTAIDETINDYRDERAQASSIGARLWSDVQCVAALGRVLALTAARDLAAGDTWRVVGSCALWSVAVSPFVLLLLWSSNVALLAVPSWIVFVVLLTAALVFGPIAALGLFDRADRSLRIGGPLVASTLLMLVMMGWVIPAATESFRVAAWTAVDGGVLGGQTLLRGPNELDLPALVRRSWNDSWNLAFTQALVIRAAVILAAPTGLLLGAAIRRRWRHRVNWRVLQVTGLLAAVAIIVSVWLAEQAWSMSYFRGRGLNLEVVGRVWLPIVVAWLMTSALVRGRSVARSLS